MSETRKLIKVRVIVCDRLSRVDKRILFDRLRYNNPSLLISELSESELKELGWVKANDVIMKLVCLGVSQAVIKLVDREINAYCSGKQAEKKEKVEVRS